MRIETKIDVCDFCVLDTDNIKLAKKTCVVCGKHSCGNSGCHGLRGDILNDSLPYELRSLQIFLCSECTTKLSEESMRNSGYTKGDAHRSGSVKMCRLADFILPIIEKNRAQIKHEIIVMLKTFAVVGEKNEIHK